MNENMPFMAIPKGADICILLYLSLYTYQLIDLLTAGLDRPDFNETLVHHMCAVSFIQVLSLVIPEVSVS